MPADYDPTMEPDPLDRVSVLGRRAQAKRQRATAEARRRQEYVAPSPSGLELMLRKGADLPGGKEGIFVQILELAEKALKGANWAADHPGTTTAVVFLCHFGGDILKRVIQRRFSVPSDGVAHQKISFLNTLGRSLDTLRAVGGIVRKGDALFQKYQNAKGREFLVEMRPRSEGDMPRPEVPLYGSEFDDSSSEGWEEGA